MTPTTARRRLARAAPPLLALVLGASCLTPRSITLGTMAAPLGKGSTEVGVFGGVGYVSQVDPPVTTKDPTTGDTYSTQTSGRGFALPGAEANVQYGLTDRLAFNVHASSAGLQPGLKWTLNRSKIFNVALLPAVGFGYASFGGATLAAGTDGLQREVEPHSTTSFTFLGGFKVLVSHRSGFYAGVGYDLVFNRSLTSGTLGTGNVTDQYLAVTVTVMHQVMAALGIDIALGQVHLRPEVAFGVVPLFSSTWYTKTGTSETNLAASGGYAFTVMPGFSLAVASPPRPRAEAAEGDDRPARDGDEDEDDRPVVKKRHRLGEDDGGDVDDEDDPPRRRRRPADEDD